MFSFIILLKSLNELTMPNRSERYTFQIQSLLFESLKMTDLINLYNNQKDLCAMLNYMREIRVSYNDKTDNS